jgi:hypothetical protein
VEIPSDPGSIPGASTIYSLDTARPFGGTRGRLHARGRPDRLAAALYIALFEGLAALGLRSRRAQESSRPGRSTSAASAPEIITASMPAPWVAAPAKASPGIGLLTPIGAGAPVQP